MARTVLLRHDLPDGTFHYDWLIQRPDAPTLISFRVRVRIDEAGCAGFDAEPGPDHRPEYLEYEGPVSGGHGTVRRLASGKADAVTATRAGLEVTVDFGHGWQRCAGRPASASRGNNSAAGGSWIFHLTPLEPPDAAR